MQVRCPQCHAPIERASDDKLSDIVCPSCGSSFSLLSDAETMPYEAGTKTIGHFDLVQKIGVGTFGFVWKARDKELDRTVAIKIPRKGQLDPDETEQFLREARAAAQVRHPGIVSVHEVGRDQATVFIVSDFVEGVTLADRLTAQKFSCREAAELCAKIADALHHAHGQGVIHRDLKPGNIILDAAGEPHIMDFGLARREAGEVTMTVEGRVLGTPAYMSPEQAKGAAHTADRRSDVYSLGVILFEMLTSERPFRGNVRMLVHQVINDEPPSPRRLNGSIPRDLETICLKCLEKEPGKRYATAKALAEDLRRFVAGKAIEARPVMRLERGWRWCKRNSAIAGLVGFVAMLLLALVGFSLLLARVESRRAAAEKQRAEERRIENYNANRAAERAITAEHAAQGEAEQKRRLLYISDMSVAQQAWEAANVSRVIGLLKRHLPFPGQEDLRGFEWYYLWKLCEPSMEVRTLAHSFPVATVAFSPDGRLLTTGTSAEVRFWAGNDNWPLPRTTTAALTIAFDSDGRTLAVSDGPRIVLWNILEDKELRTLPGHRNVITSLAFSPHGSELLSSSFDPTMVVWDWTKGTEIGLLRGHKDWVESMALSPDGTTIASGSRDGTVKLWDLKSRQELATLEGHTAGVKSVAFSPSDGILATAGIDRNIILWNPLTRKRICTFSGHRGTIRSVCFSPNGNTLASASIDNTVRLWDLARRELKETFKGHANFVQDVAFSPTGQTLASASADTTVKLWNVDAKRAPILLRGHTDSVNVLVSGSDGPLISGSRDRSIRVWNLDDDNPAMRFEAPDDVLAMALSPNGKILASAGRDDVVTVWEMATGKVLRSLQGHSRNIRSLKFAPDGRTVASGSDDRTVRLWKVDTSQEPVVLHGHTSRVDALAYSPNGLILASGSRDTTIKLWSAETGANLSTLRGHTQSVDCLAFSPDGVILASGGDDTVIKLWTVTGGGEIAALQGHGGPVLSLAFSPDGKTLFSSAGDGMVKLWDSYTHEEKLSLGGHEDWVSSLSVLRGGSVLASASHDRTIRFWRAATPEEVEAAGEWWKQ